jgi:hypothetical protein
MKMSHGGVAPGSRQSISLLNKSQNVGHTNVNAHEPSIIVNTSNQRARSSNKSATGPKNQGGQTL